jgi:hypothetical protein
MSNQIEKAYKSMFKEGFEQAFQQSNSRLRSYVEVESQASEFDYFDRIGLADDMAQVTTRYGDNPVNEISHDKRRIGLKDYELGKPIDEKDLLRVVSDPTSSYMQAMVASANRKIDDLIIAGLTAPAYTGKSGEVAVNFVTTAAGKVSVGAVSNVSSNFVASTYGALEAGTEGIDVNATYTGTTPATAGLSLAKLKIVRTTMLKLEAIEQDQLLNCFITSQQFQDLLAIDEVINSDYATRKALAEGSITTFMGYRFIHSERLPLSGGIRQCFVTLPKAYKLSIGKDIKADMWRLPAQKNIPYLYTSLAMGGSRMWGEVLARVGCSEA